MKTFDPRSIEPIPVKKLGRYVIFVDGHTRAFAAFQNGLSEVTVYWEDEELDWDAYRICVEWCEKEGIHTISDLQNRIISQQDYDVLWLERCKKMQEDLEAKRKQKVFLAERLNGKRGLATKPQIRNMQILFLFEKPYPFQISLPIFLEIPCRFGNL